MVLFSNMLLVRGILLGIADCLLSHRLLVFVLNLPLFCLATMPRRNADGPGVWVDGRECNELV